MSGGKNQLTPAQLQFARQAGAHVPPHSSKTINYGGMVFVYREDARWLVDRQGRVVDVLRLTKLAA